MTNVTCLVWKEQWHVWYSRPVPESTEDDVDDDDEHDAAAPMDLSGASRIALLSAAGFRAREESSALPASLAPSLPSIFPRVRERVQLRHQTIDRRDGRSVRPALCCRAFCPERIFSMMSIMMMKIIVIMSRAELESSGV